MTTIRVYNYPWAGQLGRLTDACIVCGDDGPKFQLSSFGATCIPCRGKEPHGDRLVEFLQRGTDAARAWCEERGFDYYEIVEKLALWYGGEPDQERPSARESE